MSNLRNKLWPWRCKDEEQEEEKDDEEEEEKFQDESIKYLKAKFRLKTVSTFKG